MVYMAAIMLFLYPIPWIGLLIIFQNFTSIFLLPSSFFLLPSFFLALRVIWHQYELRRLGAEISECPPKYWWLGGFGGSLVGAIAIGSAIKTQTGWGWTWRGRALKSQNI
jgi:hypothetical protein